MLNETMPPFIDDPDYVPLQPERGAEGWAVKLDGVISIRTASVREENAMANGLVLMFGLHERAVGALEDCQIRAMWENCVRVTPSRKLEIVEVVCKELARMSPRR